MTDNEIIANEILCIRRRASGKCNGGTDCNTCDLLMNETEIINAYQRAMKQNDLINRQKEEIEELEETRYELACIIDELLMCIAEGKETKSAKPIDINEIKSEAIKEFAEKFEYFILNEDVEIVKPKCKYYGSYINGANQFRHQIKNGIKKLVKEMEVSE